MVILLVVLIVVFFLIIGVMRHSKLSKSQKTLISLGIILVVVIGFTYFVINGWERGRDPQKPEIILNR